MTPEESRLITQVIEISSAIGELKSENKILKEQNEKLWKLFEEIKSRKTDATPEGEK